MKSTPKLNYFGVFADNFSKMRKYIYIVGQNAKRQLQFTRNRMKFDENIWNNENYARIFAKDIKMRLNLPQDATYLTVIGSTDIKNKIKCFTIDQLSNVADDFIRISDYELAKMSHADFVKRFQYDLVIKYYMSKLNKKIRLMVDTLIEFMME